MRYILLRRWYMGLYI